MLPPSPPMLKLRVDHAPSAPSKEPLGRTVKESGAPAGIATSRPALRSTKRSVVQSGGGGGGGGEGTSERDSKSACKDEDGEGQGKVNSVSTEAQPSITRPCPSCCYSGPGLARRVLSRAGSFGLRNCRGQAVRLLSST